MLQDVLPGIGQMVGFCCSRLCGFRLFENIILVSFTQAACLCTLICSFVLFREDVAAFRAAFGLAAQDPALPLPRREGEHGTSAGQVVGNLDVSAVADTFSDRIISYTTLHVFTLTPGGDAQLPGEPSYGSI